MSVDKVCYYHDKFSVMNAPTFLRMLWRWMVLTNVYLRLLKHTTISSIQWRTGVKINYQFENSASHILSRWFKGLIYTTVEKFASLWFLLVICCPEKVINLVLVNFNTLPKSTKQNA